MLKTLLTALVFTATTTTALAVSFAEGPDELNDTPQAPYIFDLDLGENVFSGDVGNECGDPEGPGPMKTANCVADAVDAFRTNLLSDHKITGVTFSGPAASTIPTIPNGATGPDAFDFIITADTDANGAMVQSDWSVEITVAKVPLPATQLLALGDRTVLQASQGEPYWNRSQPKSRSYAANRRLRSFIHFYELNQNLRIGPTLDRKIRPIFDRFRPENRRGERPDARPKTAAMIAPHLAHER